MSVVLVTGASRGLGRATVEALHAAGHQVVATAREQRALDDLPPTVAAARLPLDVTDDASVRAAVRSAEEQVGPVEVVVNNAAAALEGPTETVPPAALLALYDTNVAGPLRVIQAVLPTMRERGRGVVVNVSSVAGKVAPPLGGLYSSSKYALEALTEALRVEVAHFGVRVVLVEPGGIDTGMREAMTTYSHPAYAPLADQRARRGQTGATPAADIAAVLTRAVGAALTAGTPDAVPLRWPAGADADYILGLRASMDDATWEKGSKAQLGIDW